MIAGAIVHTGPGQAPLLRIGIAVNYLLRPFMSVDVEGRQLREETQVRIGRVIMNPPCQRTPVLAAFVNRQEPVHGNTRRRAHRAFVISPVPDMCRKIEFVR